MPVTIAKKDATILSLLILTVMMGIGWFTSISEDIPLDNLQEWTEIFHGYEAYLDRRIFYSVVHGTSMEPTLSENDRIIWVEVDPAELKVYDIIIYEHPTKPSSGLIAHRIIRIIKNEEYLFETKGDNRSVSDAETPIGAYYVSEDDLKGLVIGVIYRSKPVLRRGTKEHTHRK